MRARLRRLWLLITDPAEWSAQHYERKNRMDLAALMPHTWRTREELDADVETGEQPAGGDDRGGGDRRQVR